MGLKMWVANLVLAGLASFCGIQAYAVWSKDGRHAFDAPADRMWAAPNARKAAGRESPPESEFEIVAVKNLFSPERREIEPEPEPTPEEPAAEEEKKPDRVDDLKAEGKKMHLYGVIIAEGYQAALITNPNWKTDKRPQAWVRPGDAVEGFHVAAIETDRIVLASEGNEVEMFLYDKSKPKTAPPPPASAPVRASVTQRGGAARPSPPPTRSVAPGRAGVPRGAPSAQPADRTGDTDPRRMALQERLKERTAPTMPTGYGKFYSGKK